MKLNFLPDQYKKDSKLKISHNYLREQFSDYSKIFKEITNVVKKGDYTLGSAVDECEKSFAKRTGAKYAIGVGNGTDALFLALKALNIGRNDEVITTPFTFVSTTASIVTTGAKPVFVDIKDDYNIDENKIESAITRKTKAIMPVHWSGKPCDMDSINMIAEKHKIPVIEDACHAIQAKYKGRSAGNLGSFGCFSFHPLKNLNVWGDGGIITTNSDDYAKRLKLIRNHGLIGRNECVEFAYNSRLDTIQAVVAHHMLDKIDHITDSRINNAKYLDEKLKGVTQLEMPIRNPEIREVFHLYMLKAERRDELQSYLISQDIDAKVHYPIPMHLQEAAKKYNYSEGDFPKCESAGKSVISFPVHEFITKEHLDKIVYHVKSFYES